MHYKSKVSCFQIRSCVNTISYITIQERAVKRGGIIRRAIVVEFKNTSCHQITLNHETPALFCKVIGKLDGISVKLSYYRIKLSHDSLW